MPAQPSGHHWLGRPSEQLTGVQTIQEGRLTGAWEPDLPRRPQLGWWQRSGTREAGGVPITNLHGAFRYANPQHNCASVAVREKPGKQRATYKRQVQA